MGKNLCLMQVKINCKYMCIHTHVNIYIYKYNYNHSVYKNFYILFIRVNESMMKVPCEALLLPVLIHFLQLDVA